MCLNFNSMCLNPSLNQLYQKLYTLRYAHNLKKKILKRLNLPTIKYHHNIVLDKSTSSDTLITYKM